MLFNLQAALAEQYFGSISNYIFSFMMFIFILKIILMP